VHEVAPAAAETNGAAAQFVGLPSTSRRNGAGTEQNFGDLAARAAFKPAVEAAEHQSEPAALLRCQGVRRLSGGAARQGVEQAACRFSARGEAVVEWDYDGHSPGGVHAADERYRQRITSSIEEPVLAIRRRARDILPTNSRLKLSFAIRIIPALENALSPTGESFTRGAFTL